MRQLWLMFAGLGATLSAPAQVLAQAVDEQQEVHLELPVEPGGYTAASVAARAVEVAPQVESAELAYEQAIRNADLGRIAYSPRLDLSASYTRLSDIDTPPFEFGGVEIDSPFEPILNNYDLRATFTVNISDYFLTIAPTYETLEHLIDVRAYEVDVQELALAMQAQETFYSYVRASAALLVAEDAVALLTAHIQDLEELQGAGVVTTAEVMQARAQLAGAEGEVLILQAGIETSAILLRRILNLEPNTPIPIGEDVNELDPRPLPDEALLIETAMEARPEVRALRALTRVQEATLESYEGSRWPRLQLFFNTYYSNPNPRVVPQEEEFSGGWDLTLMLGWSPNDAVEATIRSQQTEVQIQRAEQDLAAIEDGVAIEVAGAINAHRTALAGHGTAREGVLAAREAYRVQTELLAVGEATANEALDAEIAIRRAMFALIDASIAARLARVRLEHALGSMHWESAE